jgi:TetR/AcrR family transcriptional regulator, regulator of autoinduction and epiphytic fitness
MTEVDAKLPADDADEVDPRWVRSRTRLLDAAVDLLRSGGIEAVTIDAVTKASKGSLRDRLVELVCRQATLYEEAPLHPTTLAWIALRSTADSADDAQDWQRSNSTLQARVVDHYLQPFEAILHGPEAHTKLDEYELELAVCQLIGPLLFAWMIGLRVIDHQDCARIVDDFLAAHARDDTATASQDAQRTAAPDGETPPIAPN